MTSFTNLTRKYLEMHTPEEVEQVHQSPQSEQNVKRTLLESILLVPQYIVAWGIYLDICILYYGISKTHGIVLGIAFIFGFYSEEVTLFSAICEVFVADCIVSIISLKFFFSNKHRVVWLYNIVGEKRIRHKVFESPAMGRLGKLSTSILLGIAATEMSTHAGGAVVDGGITAFQHNLNEEQRTNGTAHLNNEIAKIKGLDVSDDVKDVFVAQVCAEKLKLAEDYRARKREINNMHHNRTGGLMLYLAKKETWENLGDRVERILDKVTRPKQ